MSFDPEKWLESTVHEIHDYVTSQSNTRIYDVVMDYPGAEIDSTLMPLNKTLIHFAVDEIVSREVGMGDNVFNDNFNPDTGEIRPQTAMSNEINFDVGIWASDRSGGSTSRMRARQLLQNLFGIGSVDSFRQRTDGGDGGIEIRRFTGGRFIVEQANDVRIYRMIDCQMDVRVYSRTPITFADPGVAIEVIRQVPDLSINS